MKFKLEPNALPPVREHREDAGVDLRTPFSFLLSPKGSRIIDTGVHVEIPAGWVGLLKSKSGLNVHHGIVGEGVIDSGYTGLICVKLYNLSDRWMGFARGDKIIQLVVVPCMLAEVEIVDEISGGERGNGGFGSTGR